MAFKAVSTNSLTPNKRYLWVSADLGNGMKEWHYVTPDADTTVEVSNYITGEEYVRGMKPGDKVWLLRVASIDDTRVTVQEDIAAGFVDVSLHIVLSSDGGGINLSQDVLVATVTYTS